MRFGIVQLKITENLNENDDGQTEWQTNSHSDISLLACYCYVRNDVLNIDSKRIETKN